MVRKLINLKIVLSNLKIFKIPCLVHTYTHIFEIRPMKLKFSNEYTILVFHLTLSVRFILCVMYFIETMGFFLRKYQPLKIKSIVFVRFKFWKQIWNKNKIINRTSFSSNFKYQTFLLFMLGGATIIALKYNEYLRIIWTQMIK